MIHCTEVCHGSQSKDACVNFKLTTVGSLQDDVCDRSLLHALESKEPTIPFAKRAARREVQSKTPWTPMNPGGKFPMPFLKLAAGWLTAVAAPIKGDVETKEVARSWIHRLGQRLMSDEIDTVKAKNEHCTDFASQGSGRALDTIQLAWTVWKVECLPDPVDESDYRKALHAAHAQWVSPKALVGHAMPSVSDEQDWAFCASFRAVPTKDKGKFHICAYLCLIDMKWLATELHGHYASESFGMQFVEVKHRKVH
jgi:hypothetical protein